jgi:hypothetical protein
VETDFRYKVYRKTSQIESKFAKAIKYMFANEIILFYLAILPCKKGLNEWPGLGCYFQNKLHTVHSLPEHGVNSLFAECLCVV